jgi:hypothetical protein
MSYGVKKKYDRVIIVDPQLKDRKGHNYRYAKGIAEQLGISAVIISNKDFVIDKSEGEAVDIRPSLSFDQYDNSAFKKSYKFSKFEKLDRLRLAIENRLKNDNGLWGANSPLGILMSTFFYLFNFFWYFPALIRQVYLLLFGNGSSSHTDLAATELELAFKRLGIKKGDLIVMQTMLWPTFESLLELRLRLKSKYPCDAVFIVHEGWDIYNTMYIRFSPSKFKTRVLESLPFKNVKVVSTNESLSKHCEKWGGYFPQVIEEINPVNASITSSRILEEGKLKILIPGVYRGDKNFESVPSLIKEISKNIQDAEIYLHETTIAKVKLPVGLGYKYRAYSSLDGLEEWLKFLNGFNVILIPYGKEYKYRISGILHEARLLNVPVICSSEIADSDLLIDKRCVFGKDGQNIAEAVQAASEYDGTSSIFRAEKNINFYASVLDTEGWVKSEEKPIAVQIKPAWTRCGTSNVLDAQLDTLVDAGFFVVEIYLKQDVWQLQKFQVDHSYSVMRAGREFSAGMAVRVLYKNVTLFRMLSYLVSVLRGGRSAYFERENKHISWCQLDKVMANFLTKNKVKIALVNHIFNNDFARKYVNAEHYICETHDLQINQLLLRKPELSDYYLDELNYELRVLDKYDAIVNLNRAEHTIIEGVVGEKAYYIPPPIYQRPLKHKYPTLSGLLMAESKCVEIEKLPNSLDLLIVADGHPANIRSVEFFLSDILPLLPGNVTLGIAGTICKYISLQTKYTNNVFLFGYIDDLANIFDFAKINLLPDIEGEGIPIKTNEAIARKIPFVATEHAMRGFTRMELNEAQVSAAKSPEDFIVRIDELLTDSTKREDSVRGLNLLSQNYSVEKYQNNWQVVLNKLSRPESSNNANA